MEHVTSGLARLPGAKRPFPERGFWTSLLFVFSGSGGVHACLVHEGASSTKPDDGCQHPLIGLDA